MLCRHRIAIREGMDYFRTEGGLNGKARAGLALIATSGTTIAAVLYLQAAAGFAQTGSIPSDWTAWRPNTSDDFPSGQKYWPKAACISVSGRQNMIGLRSFFRQWKISDQT